MTTTQPDKGSLPATEWGLFEDVRSGKPAAKLAALDILIRRYWKPAFLFLQYSGVKGESVKDLTQSFFSNWIENEAFAKADERKGRFRSFMLSSLKRFAVNEHRADHARKRRPKTGLVSLDELMDNAEMPFEPKGNMDPEQIFEKAWATEVVQRVLNHLELECKSTNKAVHFDIFTRRIIKPIMDGTRAPLLVNLGREHGLTQRQAANYLLTVKRAYQRLLQEEIRLYADSEAEVLSEVRELFRVLGQ